MGLFVLFYVIFNSGKMFFSPIFDRVFRNSPIPAWATYVYMGGVPVCNRADLFFAIPVGGTAFFRIFVCSKAYTKYYHTR